MYSQNIVPLLCKKNNISFICFNDSYKIVEFDENIFILADNKQYVKNGGDVRDAFWEFIGLEEDITALQVDNEKKEKSVQIPMMHKNTIYYDVEVEICSLNNNEFYIAYFTKKTEVLLSYTKMVRDINKKTLIFQNEDTHRRKKEQHHKLINQKLLTFHVDINGMITEVNDKCSNFFSLNKEAMLGIHFSNFFETRESKVADVKVLFAIDLNGDSVFFHSDVVPLSKNNVIYENIIVCQDITYLKKIEAELVYAARHDSLTGLPNRSYLLDKMDHAIATCKLNNSSLAVCFIDLNKFKPVNDTYGHHAGDMLLKHIATLLKSMIRESDTVARIGGDEFVILFEDIQNKNYIDATIKRIEDTAQNTPLLYSEDDTIHFSFSLGTSFFPADGERADLLLEAADKEMYRVKKSNK